jgi:hypothetical protein
MNLSREELVGLAESIGIEYAALMAFISVESGGAGFVNGRIVIQFEPTWFRKKAPFAPSGLWSINKVENQIAEYKAFSDAFKKNPDAAMQATSWGLGQIMGYHYGRLGFKTVGAMVDAFKTGDYQQVKGMVKFIATSPALLKAIKSKNWHLVAVNYNGGGYMELAKKYDREPYNISLEKAYKKYSK